MSLDLSLVDENPLEDWFYAYRKAKADCFEDRLTNNRQEFTAFEQDLANNLINLRDEIEDALNDNSEAKDSDPVSRLTKVLCSYLGAPKLIAKKFRATTKVSDEGKSKCVKQASAHFSDPKRAFAALADSHQLTAELRLIGDFPVEMHILSAYWVNLIGHKLDARLSRDAYGFRLRRSRAECPKEDKLGKYQLNAIGSFKSYFAPYRQWRMKGFDAIRRELKAGGAVIAIAMDFSNYFHRIDPRFFANEQFLQDIGVKLDEKEQLLNQAFANALTAWAEQVKTLVSNLQVEKTSPPLIGGLPIGLSISQIVANALLINFDKAITQQLTPVYYGRYADDIILVLRDPKNLANRSDVLCYLEKRVPYFERVDGSCDIMRLDLSKTVDCKVDEENDTAEPDNQANGMPHWSSGQQLSLQPDKLKVFFLEGKNGLDFLESINWEIYNLSSERRLLASPTQFTEMVSAKVLTTAELAVEQPDSLHKADGLSIKRQGLSLQLRALKQFLVDLPTAAWRKERKQFYSLVNNHVFRPEALLDYSDRLPEIFGLVISVGDWNEALELLKTYFCALETLFEGPAPLKIEINGYTVAAAAADKKSVYTSFVEATQAALTDEFIASLPWAPDQTIALPPENTLDRFAECFGWGAYPQLPQPDNDNSQGNCGHELQHFAEKMCQADLARIAYTEYLRHHTKPPVLGLSTEASDNDQHADNGAENSQTNNNEVLLVCAYKHLNAIKEFLEKTALEDPPPVSDRVYPGHYAITNKESLLPYLFPTRPYSARNIFLFLSDPSLYNNNEEERLNLWAKYTYALRGSWTQPFNDDNQEQTRQRATKQHSGQTTQQSNLVRIGKASNRQVRLGITNLLTSDASYLATADGKSDLSNERYKRIIDLVNLAIQSSPQPTHLLLPELALPERWLDTITRQLGRQRISLIAGLDYTHPKSHKPKDASADESPSEALSTPRKIISQAALVLTDNRLGYDTLVEIRQTKARPAPGEEKNLLHKNNAVWAQKLQSHKKPVYIHKGFCFGVLVCSELQNITYRKQFQGAVDCLMVLSWNSDLSTFGVLVESASLDVHAHIALVNNRLYGDSRVRSPAKISYQRDVCQVRGGENDYLAVVEIDTDNLRAFQSRAKRWPENDDPYKPVPEGYEIAAYRKRTPW